MQRNDPCDSPSIVPMGRVFSGWRGSLDEYSSLCSSHFWPGRLPVLGQRRFESERGGIDMTTQNHPSMPIESGYVPVNGLQMYYEIHGSGRPLVLLHGNLSAIGTSFGKVLPRLASSWRIIAVEQQGHGHTADIDRPFSIEQWAQDTIALLRHLGIEQADFFGYSSGGAVAL